MEQFNRHLDIDLAPFLRDGPDLPTKYGLPAEVKFCKSCVVSNQRPNSTVEFKNTVGARKATINFDEQGVCDACRVAERKRTTIDWAERESQLRNLCDRYRRKDGRYDCLVPGSGGKDSIYASWLLKFKYRMNPLTVTWAPNIYTPWGWKNFQNWIHSGFDNHLVTPNGRVHRLLTRLALEVLLHPFQPFILGQKQMAPILARQFDIPLVFYGENEAEYGNPQSDSDSALRQAIYHSTHDDNELCLAGVSINDLKTHFGLTANDLQVYLPPKPETLETKNIEVHYVGYYEKWHPQSCYYHAVEHCGFEACPERNPGTFSKYSSIDDRMDDLHFYTTFVKFGIGRATYDAAQEVRSGDLQREEAVHLVRRFDGEFPIRFLGDLFPYLSLPAKEFPVASKMFEQPIMDRDYFEHLCDRGRSPHLWRLNDGKWQLRHAVWNDG
jgi:N-acetyl sugar amidotransferase